MTARIHEDIPLSTLAEKLNELPELNINKTGSVTRLGFWKLGRDMLGDKSFKDFWQIALILAKQRVGRRDLPDWRDWDHLHAHYLLKRDVFLTWDKGILCLSKELRDRFGIVVMKPEEYLQTINNDNL